MPVPELPQSLQSQQEILEDEVSTVKGKVRIEADGSVIVTRPDGVQQVIGKLAVLLHCIIFESFDTT